MYEIIFYEDVNGYSDVESYIRTLRNRAKTSKDARINLNKIVAYMDILEELGTRVGEPVTKHLDGEIWELRPLNNRILYAYYKDKTFIILTQFLKKTKKSPKREIEKAVRRLVDYKRRNEIT